MAFRAPVFCEFGLEADVSVDARKLLSSALPAFHARKLFVVRRSASWMASGRAGAAPRGHMAGLRASEKINRGVHHGVVGGFDFRSSPYSSKLSRGFPPPPNLFLPSCSCWRFW